MIKTRIWIIFFAAFFSITLAVTYFLYHTQKENPTARIYIDGNCVQSIDLASAEDGYFVIETEYGSNTVAIASHKICVSNADCPCRTCVKTGWISDGTIPIVCLPHHLVVKIESAGKNADTVTR